MKSLILLLHLLLLSGVAGPAYGQQVEGEFTLLIYGQQMESSAVEIELMKNPGLENHWIAVDKQQVEWFSNDVKERMQLLAISGLSSKMFVGQDIRENYIGLRIQNVSRAETDSVQFRGAWAIEQSVDTVTTDKLQQWSEWIRHDPEKLRKYAIAHTVYPRNRPINPDDALIEHVELPVRHLKAGLQEIEWLELLFSR